MPCSKNWWSRNGGPETTPIGDPCGPDSEMFYDFGTPHDTSYGERCHPNCDCGRFMEIGNNVFMAYKKISESEFVPLEKPNIDHGSGLERIAAAKLGDPDVFKISLMWPIIEQLQKLSGKKYESHTTSMRVIADHLRAATFLAVDGCMPSNKEQGYVMRRLIRRAVRFAFDLGIEQNFLEQVVPVIADIYTDDFPEVAAKRDEVIAVLDRLDPREWLICGLLYGSGLRLLEALQIRVKDILFERGEVVVRRGKGGGDQRQRQHDPVDGIDPLQAVQKRGGSHRKNILRAPRTPYLGGMKGSASM